MLCPEELLRVATQLRVRATKAELPSGADDLLTLAQECEEQALRIRRENLPCDPTLTMSLPD